MKKQRTEKTFENLAQHWLKQKKIIVKQSTYDKYYSTINNHIIPKIGNIKVNTLNSSILQEYISSKFKSGRLNENGGLSAKTINDIVTIIKSIIKFGVIQNYMKASQNISVIKPKKQEAVEIFNSVK